MAVISGALRGTLKAAIDMERNGLAMYKEASRKSKNPLLKRVFSALSIDEKFHIQAIKKYIGGSRLKFNKMPGKTRRSSNDILFGAPLKPLKEKLRAVNSDVTAYKFAMTFERKGYNFYKRHRAKTGNGPEAELLEFLMNEEAKHFNILQKSFEYLEHPADWFRAEERPIVEGG